MAIGAKDYIEKLLVEKYGDQQVDNHDEDALKSKISADDIMAAMNVAGAGSKAMVGLNNRLTMVCYGVIAQSAKYVKTSQVK